MGDDPVIGLIEETLPATREAMMLAADAEFERELMAAAQDQAASETTSGLKFIALGKDKKFRLDDTLLGEEEGTVLRVIILHAAYEKAYFGKRFKDISSAEPPKCFALSYDGSNMRPVAELKNPENDVCETCSHNQFGTAEGGDGKACKDGRRVAMVAFGEMDYSKAPALYMRTPPTSGTTLSTYLFKVTNIMKRPSFAVVTKMTFDSRTDYQKLKFETERVFDLKADKPVLMQLMEKRKSIEEITVKAFVRTEQDDKPAAEDGSKKVKY